MSNFRSLAQWCGWKLLAPQEPASLWACDIVIPAIERDATVLEESLKCIRQRLSHPIGQIFIVAPPSEILREVSARHDAVFVDEKAFMGFGPKDLPGFGGENDRRGWVFQQLIKISADRLGRSPWILILDADVVFLRNVSFERNGKLAIFSDGEPFVLYLEVAKKLLGQVRENSRGHVCDHFFLSRTDLVEFQRVLSDGGAWIEKVIDTIPRSDMSGFSEYETLAQFLLAKKPEAVVEEYIRRANMTRDIYFQSHGKRLLFPFFFRMASLHDYTADSRQK